MHSLNDRLTPAAGDTQRRREHQTLQPIEQNTAVKLFKRVKNPWSVYCDFLQDLKSKRTILVNQLQNEIIALRQECDAPNEDLQAFKAEVASKVRMIEKMA